MNNCWHDPATSFRPRVDYWETTSERSASTKLIWKFFEVTIGEQLSQTRKSTPQAKECNKRAARPSSAREVKEEEVNFEVS